MDFMVFEACWKGKYILIFLLYFFPFYKVWVIFSFNDFIKQQDVNLILITQQKSNKCHCVY